MKNKNINKYNLDSQKLFIEFKHKMLTYQNAKFLYHLGKTFVTIKTPFVFIF